MLLIKEPLIILINVKQGLIEDIFQSLNIVIKLVSSSSK